ncbi:MAG: hypothetical protein AAB837_02855 [Patescibacteria group bacterium]
MIIGNGDIAKAIKDRKDLLFFVSGVSNSQETRESEYKREVDLLSKQNKKSHIVYVSSLCVFYSNTRYAEHKRQMEGLVKKFKTWTIVRLGNITWGTNPHTLINKLKEQKQRGEKLVIQDTYRYVCERDEFDYWFNMIPSWSCEMNVPGKRMKVKEIVKKYV